jgi:predicted nucleic acid-binding protein
VIVVDASAALDLVLRRPAAARIERRLFAPDEMLAAPHVIDLEVAHVLRRLHLGGELTGARGAEALDDFAALPIERISHEPLLARIWALRANVTAYDAAYIALAEALDAPLLTLDRRLANATGHQARVELG